MIFDLDEDPWTGLLSSRTVHNRKKIAIFQTWKILLPSLGFEPGTSQLLFYVVGFESQLRKPFFSCPKICQFFLLCCVPLVYQGYHKLYLIFLFCFDAVLTGFWLWYGQSRFLIPSMTQRILRPTRNEPRHLSLMLHWTEHKLIFWLGCMLTSKSLSQAHGVWKSQRKSHSTLRAKRATFTFWVN